VAAACGRAGPLGVTGMSAGGAAAWWYDRGWGFPHVDGPTPVVARENSVSLVVSSKVTYSYPPHVP
jgi:hypothetical protein